MRDETGPFLDPEAQSELDRLLTLPEPSGTEWQRLHDAILDAATERLAQRRLRATNLHEAPRRVHRRRRWIGPALSLAAAATLLIIIGRPRPQSVPYDATAATLLADVSDTEFRHLASGHDDAVSLLLLAVQEDRERP